jgi:hypothetical protein
VGAPVGRDRGGPLARSAEQFAEQLDTANGLGLVPDPDAVRAAAWTLLPDGAAERFHDAYGPGADAATLRRARGCAVLRALVGILVGDAGEHGRPGGKAAWGPPARAALRRLTAPAR